MPGFDQCECGRRKQYAKSRCYQCLGRGRRRAASLEHDHGTRAAAYDCPLRDLRLQILTLRQAAREAAYAPLFSREDRKLWDDKEGLEALLKAAEEAVTKIKPAARRAV